MANTSNLVMNVLKRIDIHFPESGLNFNQIVQDFEEMLIMKALEASKGNYSQAAKLCGLKRTCFAAKVLKTNYVKPRKEEF